MTWRRYQLRDRVNWVWDRALVGRYDFENGGRLVKARRAREAWALMLVAGVTANKILNLDCWSDPVLDEQGVRIDLGDVLADIGARLLEASELAIDVGELPDDDGTPESAHARTVVGEQLEVIDIVLDAVRGQVAALRTYRERLAAVDRQAKAVRRAEQAQASSQRADDLLGLVGGAEVGQSSLARASQSVSDMAAARSSALAQVRGDYLAALAVKD
ncbi:hypothetical protein [Gordonia malaquae]|uniref:hypothetical protein n=1 Tax=Gordonia malaquae TaxID=410332 RepID=UPI00301B6BC3